MFETSLNLLSLNTAAQSGVLLQANQLGGGLGLFQQPGTSVDLSSVAEALPYIAVTGLGLGAVGFGVYHAVRLWRRYQETLPPPGMKDIRPERMQAFFKRHPNIEPAASLSDAEIASEIDDLTEALKARHNEKNKTLIREAIEAYENIQALRGLKEGRPVRAREVLLKDPEGTYKALSARLNRLQEYRLMAIAHYFQNAHAKRTSEIPDSKTTLETAARYAGLQANEKEALYGLALRVWQALPAEDKNFFWELRQKGDDLRGTAVAPDFLVTFAHFLPDPPGAFLATHLVPLQERLKGEIERLLKFFRTAPELPPYIRSVPDGILILKTGERSMGRIQVIRHLGTATVRFMKQVTVKGKDGTDQERTEVSQFPPRQVLTIRGPEHVTQNHWTHPDVKLTDGDGKTLPGIVSDLKEYPVLTLGGEHRLLVDFGDPRLVPLLEKFRVVRDEIQNGKITASDMANKFWNAFMVKPAASPSEVLGKAGSGILHALLDVFAANSTSEGAILLQVFFQHFGIPSRLEYGAVDLPFPRGKIDADEAGTPNAYWVRVAIPGQPVRIFCPRLNETIAEGHSSFSAFQDQTPNSGTHVAPGRTSGSGPRPIPVSHVVRGASGETDDDTPLPTPLPPVDDDDDENERVTVVVPIPGFKAPAPATPEPPQPEDPQEAETRRSPSSGSGVHDGMNFDVPGPAAGSSSASDEPTVQVPLETLTAVPVKQSLVEELMARYELFDDQSPGALETANKLAERIFAEWDRRKRPPLEKTQHGAALLIPNQIIEEVVEAWKQKLEGNTSEVAKSILRKMIDRGTWQVRQRTENLRATVIPPALTSKTSNPPPPPAPAYESLGEAMAAAANNPPAPSSIPPPESPRRKTPPPLPKSEVEKHVEITFVALQQLYPVFRENGFHSLGLTLARQAMKATAGDTSLTDEALAGQVATLLPALQSSLTFQPLLMGIRASEGIGFELINRYPALNERELSFLFFDALQRIFLAWQISGSQLEDGPEDSDNFKLIPEEVFENAMQDFKANLARNYPDIDSDVFFEAFTAGDAGSRAERWGIQVGDDEVEEVPSPPAAVPVEVSTLRQKPQPAAGEATVSDLQAEIERRYPTLVAYSGLVRALSTDALRTAAGSGLEIPQAVHQVMASLIRHLANSARTNSPLETLLRSIVERDVSTELRERYTAFQNEKFSGLVGVLSRGMYAIWDSNNRTFNGSVNALPLRIPEKFIDEGMNQLLGHLRSSDAALADLIVGSFTGNRARREELKRHPSNPPPLHPIRISDQTILLELYHRFPLLSSYEGLARSLARDVYQAWLQEDPERSLETSGAGLRGLVPEFVLEKRLKVFYGQMDTMGLGQLRRQLRDKGKRAERGGTALLEHEIRESVLGHAAA